MKKAYLFVYSDNLGTREELNERLSSIPGILHWRYEITNCYFLVATASANAISEALRSTNLKDGKFVVSEVQHANIQGWLTAKSWDFINKMPAL